MDTPESSQASVRNYLGPSNWKTPQPFFPSYPASLSQISTPSPSQKPYQRPSRAKRRADENSDSSGGLPKKKSKHIAAERTNREKLDLFFEFLDMELCWTYSELLFYTSRRVPKKSGTFASEEDSISHRHAAVLQHFLHGRGSFSPAQILENWFLHPSGRDGRLSDLMYSADTPYTDIKPVQPALTSFATQIVAKQIARETEKAVKSSNGLHVPISSKNSDKGKLVSWPKIGSATFEYTHKIITTLQPLTWKLIMKIAVRPNAHLVRKTRPPEMVATNVISMLNFSRSSRANLLPLATGLLFFGSSVNFDIFRHHSRLGCVPAYTSVLRAMRA